MSRRHPAPAGYVTYRQILGFAAVTPEAAAANRVLLLDAAALPPERQLAAWKAIGPLNARPDQPGLLPLDAAGLRRAVARGELPQPRRGRWGRAWPIAAVQALAIRK